MPHYGCRSYSFNRVGILSGATTLLVSDVVPLTGRKSAADTTGPRCEPLESDPELGFECVDRAPR